jgi:hypothetical protein
MAGDQLDTAHVIGGADQQGRTEAKVIHEALCLKDFDVGVFNKPVFLVRWFLSSLVRNGHRVFQIKAFESAVGASLLDQPLARDEEVIGKAFPEQLIGFFLPCSRLAAQEEDYGIRSDRGLGNKEERRRMERRQGQQKGKDEERYEDRGKTALSRWEDRSLCSLGGPFDCGIRIAECALNHVKFRAALHSM